MTPKQIRQGIGPIGTGQNEKESLREIISNSVAVAVTGNLQFFRTQKSLNCFDARVFLCIMTVLSLSKRKQIKSSVRDCIQYRTAERGYGNIVLRKDGQSGKKEFRRD